MDLIYFLEEKMDLTRYRSQSMNDETAEEVPERTLPTPTPFFSRKLGLSSLTLRTLFFSKNCGVNACTMSLEVAFLLRKSRSVFFTRKFRKSPNSKHQLQLCAH